MSYSYVAAVAQCRAVNGRGKQVLKVLADHAQDKVREATYYGEGITAEPGWVWLSHPAMGVEAGCSKETAKRACADLVDIGVISVVRKGGQFDGINKTTIYQVNIDAVENMDAPKKAKRKERGLHPGKKSETMPTAKYVVKQVSSISTWEEDQKDVDWSCIDRDRAQVLAETLWDIFKMTHPTLEFDSDWVNQWYEYLRSPGSLPIMTIHTVLEVLGSTDTDDLKWSTSWRHDFMCAYDPCRDCINNLQMMLDDLEEAHLIQLEPTEPTTKQEGARL